MCTEKETFNELSILNGQLAFLISIFCSFAVSQKKFRRSISQFYWLLNRSLKIPKSFIFYKYQLKSHRINIIDLCRMRYDFTINKTVFKNFEKIEDFDSWCSRPKSYFKKFMSRAILQKSLKTVPDLEPTCFFLYKIRSNNLKWSVTKLRERRERQFRFMFATKSIFF